MRGIVSHLWIIQQHRTGPHSPSVTAMRERGERDGGPSAECRKGNHLSTEVRPSVFRCIWCGLVSRAEAPDCGNFHCTDNPCQCAGSNPEVAPSDCCGGSLTRQAHFPRPTITERKDDLILDFDARFRAMARAYAESSPHLRQWQSSGNTLPSIYR